jgi:hypothetical protein
LDDARRLGEVALGTNVFIKPSSPGQLVGDKLLWFELGGVSSGIWRENPGTIECHCRRSQIAFLWLWPFSIIIYQRYFKVPHAAVHDDAA